MASKRRLRRRGCEGKVRHESAAIAHGAALIMQRKCGAWMPPYHCQFCGGFHNGHRAGAAGNLKLARATRSLAK